MIKDILIFIYFLLISYINGFLALNIINPSLRQKPLFDVGFLLLPQISVLYPNIMLLSFIGYFILRFNRGKYYSKILKLMICLCILFTLRAFTFTLTIVPPTNQNCVSRNVTDGYVWNIFKELILTEDNSCIDYMFSGHTVYLTLGSLFIFTYSVYKIEKLITFLYLNIAIGTIIASRIHYTVDVIIGMSLAMLIFKIFSKKKVKY